MTSQKKFGRLFSLQQLKEKREKKGTLKTIGIRIERLRKKRVKAYILTLTISLILGVSCVKTVFMPEEAHFYWEKWQAEQVRSDALEYQLDECLKRGQTLRDECQ